jgi:hypothetical protein
VYACVIALLHTRRTESTFSKHVVNTLSSDLEVCLCDQKLREREREKKEREKREEGERRETRERD